MKRIYVIKDQNGSYLAEKNGCLYFSKNSGKIMSKKEVKNTLDRITHNNDLRIYKLKKIS